MPKQKIAPDSIWNLLNASEIARRLGYSKQWMNQRIHADGGATFGFSQSEKVAEVLREAARQIEAEAERICQ